MPMLDGIRIIDLTSVIFGPYATQMLADMGADVIKVESPEGDISRLLGRPRTTPDMGSVHMTVNRGKRSIVLDLKQPEGVEAFLQLDLPGSKLVYGVGPVEATLRRQYPQVHWRGLVPRTALPAIYSAADVFVFPSRSETFGLVMLEAMACGTPVAAYPVAGPLDVVGDSAGGVLHEDLRTAALRALQLPRDGARARALQFDWSAVCDQFIGLLVPAHRQARLPRDDTAATSNRAAGPLPQVQAPCG
jgi:hypothetical protein